MASPTPPDLLETGGNTGLETRGDARYQQERAGICISRQRPRTPDAASLFIPGQPAGLGVARRVDGRIVRCRVRRGWSDIGECLYGFGNWCASLIMQGGCSLAEPESIKTDGETGLRRATMSDMWTVRDWRNQPHVRAGMYTNQVIGRGEHRDWYELHLADPSRQMWIIVSRGRDVGVVTLSEIDLDQRSCTWAFYIGEANLTGRGLGSAVERLVLAHVFGTLGLDTLCCEVLEFNTPVIGLHQKFGFEPTGRLENRIHRDGRPVAAICFELTRARWVATSQSKPGPSS